MSPSPPTDAWIRWLPYMTALTVALVVWLTCGTILELPQLEPDDFRYVSLVQDLEAGRIGFTQASIVENRWDHIWFVDTEAIVRFFRPTVVTSFLLDRAVFGPELSSYLITTLLLHGACCLLVTAIVFRLLGRTVFAAAGSLLFAAFACHAETIWYASGRTDTLAALGFLAAFALHVSADGNRRWLRWLALPAFAFAIVSKELAAALPVCLFLYDLLVAKRAPGAIALLQQDRWLWLGYAGTGLAFAVLRQSVLGGATSSSLAYPYFVDPLSGSFPGHLLLQARAYLGNLFAAEITPPFATWESLADYLRIAGWVFGLGGPIVLFLLTRKEPLLRVFVVLAVLTWLPTCFVYVSERYLYLPSFALAGVAAVALRRVPREWLWAGLVVAIGWPVHQALVLYHKNRHISHIPRETFALQKELDELERRPEKDAKVLFVNFPSEVLHCQFLPEHLRALYDDPTLSARVLSLMPESRAGLASVPEIRRTGPHTLRISSAGNLMGRPAPFPAMQFSSGKVIERPRLGFKVRVLDGEGTACRAFEVELDEPIERYTVLRFVRGPQLRPPFDKIKGYVILGGRVEVSRP